MNRLAYVCLGLAAACGTTISAVPTNHPVRPMTPRDPMSVEVVTTGVPPRPFVEVAYLEAQQQSEYSLDAAPEVMTKMRERAAALGCDALILGGANDAVVGSSTNGTGHTSTLRGYRGTCIQWTDLPAPDAQAAVPQ